MKAVRIHSTGGPEVMKIEEIPIPKPTSTEVLIEIKSIGVNYTDVSSRKGTNPPEYYPWIPGREAAGVVVEVGDDVTEVKIGDNVAYAMITGAYAEYATVPAWLTVPIPDAMPYDIASAILLQGMTAHFLANSITSLNNADTALVHAGAGGVGLLLIQMLKMLDVYTYTTISTSEKSDLAIAAGADLTINYLKEDFETSIKKYNPDGITIVYDAIGQTTFKKGLNVLKRRGYMVLYGTASGTNPDFDRNLLREKSIYLTCPMLGDFTSTRDELLNRANTVLEWVQNDLLSIRLGLTLPFSEVSEAHRQLEGRMTTGKVILTI
ncbi:MAG TPA: NADPH:quinone reductase [Dehalococcoidia bacterium]|jgi:NADPH2:quinone reductase|nr:NADPH:quinone reductase [Dehalococcoidia bacterium]